MRLALNLIFRILPFPKGKLFFTLRYLFFQWTPFVTACAVVLFVIVQRKIFLKTQCLLLLSLYMLVSPPEKERKSDTFSRFVKPFLTISFIIIVFITPLCSLY